jgi:hypothetical protein
VARRGSNRIQTPIYFLVEGERKQYRCEHKSGLFIIGHEHNGETEVVCGFRKRHRVLNGFYTAPQEEPEPATVWVGKRIRGEQMRLHFPKPWQQIGPEKYILRSVGAL